MIYPTSLIESLTSPSRIIVIHNGQEYNCDESEKVEIIDTIKIMFNDYHEMPAFGVSLDGETRNTKNTGLWIEFVYDTPVKYMGMRFEKLLIEVDKEYTGFNIIRYNKGKYDGRSYYVDLACSMEPLFNSLIEITKKD